MLAIIITNNKASCATHVVVFDRTLKKIDCSEAKNENALIELYESQTKKLNIHQLIHAAKEAIQNAITEQDTCKLLQWYDNKRLLAIACEANNKKVKQFQEWIIRYLRNKPDSILSRTIKEHLPNIKSNKTDI